MISPHQGPLSPATVLPERLCGNLVQGLHAAAQPLTVLLASLCKEHTDAMQTEELRELAANSALEVQRVCTLFHYLQQLLVAESIPPDLALTSIVPLLQHVAEGVHLLFEQDGMQLRWVMPLACPPLWLDHARTMQALSSLLAAVHAVSSKNDIIYVVMSCPSEQGVRIVVRHSDASVGNINRKLGQIEPRLMMAVAEANIRCQQGAFFWSLQPFRVHMELQHAPIAATGK